MQLLSSRVATSAAVLALVLSGCALLEDLPFTAVTGGLGGTATPGSDAGGVDLGPFAVDGPATFCESVGRTPLRWTTDALVPMQVWVHDFSSATEVPEDAAPAVDQLLEFTRARLAWSLGGGGDRPIWDETMNAAAITLADVAIRACPDLPLSIGLPGMSDTPMGWDQLDEGEIATQCASIGARVERGIEEFQATHQRAPRHQIEMEFMLPFFVASDFHGLALDADGQAIVVPVPGGACDIG